MARKPEHNSNSQVLDQWSAFIYRPRKDRPRIYAELDDATLAAQLSRVNQTINVLTRLDQKCWDANAEAIAIRVLSSADQQQLRRETLRTATLLRDELRQRMGVSAKSGRAM